MNELADSAVSQTELRELCRKLSREDFVRQHPWLWLVRDLSSEKVDGASFSTVAVKIPPKALNATLSSALVKSLVFLPYQFAVYPLQKSERNPWKDSVLIGRARNGDVILNDASISKLHARVDFSEKGYAITDVKSTNGTWVGNAKLAPEGESMAIQSQSSVRLGNLSFVVASSSEIHEAFST